MKTHKREILLYYDPEDSVAKKTLAYAHSICNHINEKEWQHEHFTPTVWRRILFLLGMKAKDLLNKSHPYYQEHIRGRDFGDDDWTNILMKRPDLIRAPIAIWNDRAVVVCSPTDIYKLVQQFQDAFDMAAIPNRESTFG